MNAFGFLRLIAVWIESAVVTLSDGVNVTSCDAIVSRDDDDVSAIGFVIASSFLMTKQNKFNVGSCEVAAKHE